MIARFFWMVVCVATLCCNSVSAQNFFWSDLGFNEGASDDDLVIDAAVGDAGSAFLYYTPNGQDIELGLDLDFGFNSSGVAGFTAAETFQADILFGLDGPTLGNRWGTTGFTFGPADEVTANSVTGFFATSIAFESGILVSNIPGNSLFVDALYDVDAEAFLIGSFDWEALSIGSTAVTSNEISGQVADFPDGLPATDIFDSVSFSSVTINVIPEPTCAALIALSTLVLVSRRRR